MRFSSNLRGSLFAAFAAVAACSSPDERGLQPPGLLSISVSPRLVPPPAASDFAAAFDLVYAAGVRGQYVSYNWSDLEPTQGSLDLTSIRNDITDASARGFQILVGIRVINTVARETPADLQAVAFSDSGMKVRFHVLLDSLLPSLNTKVLFFTIGNEVNDFLESTGQWSEYQDFYEDAVAYLHTRRPGLKIGVTGTYDPANTITTAKLAGLNAMSDVIIYTHYPLFSNYHPTGPNSVAAVLEGMLASANGKSVLVQELGYPSDPLLGSSEADQAVFFTNALHAWGSLGPGRIPFLNLFLLHDLTPEICDTLAQYYGDPNGAGIKAFLCSLGLRRDDGQPKAAWGAVVSTAKEIGLP